MKARTKPKGATMDDALWFCQVPSHGSVTGTCDEMVPQPQLESHLWKEHKIRPSTPEEVLTRFTLARGSHHGRAPRPAAAADQTLAMFERSDFR